MNVHCETLSTKSELEHSPVKPLHIVRSELASSNSSAIENLLTRIYERIKTYLNHRKMRRIDRDAFQHLAKLDESTLQDIGVSRADVEWAMKLPLSQNASDALQQVSRGYKKRA